MIAQVELAILAALKAAADAGRTPFGWSSLETYPVEWDTWLKEKSGTLPAPAAWVVFGGWTRPESYGSNARYPCVFGLVVMAENARDEQVRRHGDPVDVTKPGSYALAEYAARILGGSTLGLDIDTIKIGALRHVLRPEAMRQRKVSMMSLELHTSIALPDLIDPATRDPFAVAHINWDIPVLGNVGPDLPDDAEADATDHIALET